MRKGKRGRKKPDRLGDRGPDAFSKEREDDDEQDGKGMSYHAFMRKHLKQYGGNMAKAAAAYRQQKGGGIIDDLERDIGIGGKPRAPAAAAGSAGAPKPMGNSTAGSAGAPKPMSGGHYARADGSIRPKDRGKYGHTHRPGKNAAVRFEDAQEDEPERAPSPPRRRITRNVSPRTRRRLEREQGGRGYEDQDGGNWWSAFKDDAKSVGNHVVATAKHDWATGKKLYGENQAFIKKHKWAADLEHGAEGVAMAGFAATGVGALAEFGAAGVAGIEGLTAATEGLEGLSAATDVAGDAGDITMDTFSGSLEDGTGTLTSDAGAAGDTGAAGDDAGGDDAGGDGGDGNKKPDDDTVDPKTGKKLTARQIGAKRTANFRANVTKIRNFAGTAVVGDEVGNEAGDLDNPNEPEDGSTSPPPPDPTGAATLSQLQQMQQQEKQQAQMHANADAFAANSAALKHGDYLNPF